MSIPLSQQVVGTRPEYRDAYLILGHSYLKLARFDLAHNAFKEARKLDPTSAEATFLLGVAQSEMGLIDDAITHLTMARANDYEPKNELAKALAKAYARGQYYDKARGEYENLLGTQSNVTDYVQPIRISIEILDDPQYAKNLATKASNQFPNDPFCTKSTRMGFMGQW